MISTDKCADCTIGMLWLQIIRVTNKYINLEKEKHTLWLSENIKSYLYFEPHCNKLNIDTSYLDSSYKNFNV